MAGARVPARPPNNAIISTFLFCFLDIKNLAGLALTMFKPVLAKIRVTEFLNSWALLKMTSPNQHDDHDGRATERKKTLRAGTIVYNHRMSTMECAIFDLSETGARLRLTDALVLPDAFELQVLYGETYQCKVVHKTRDQIGVRFV